MTQTITLAGGCFWCLEAVFKKLKGVSSVIPGYSGGKTENPSYEAVCSGITGHAEAVEIIFDAKVISLEVILDVFWKLHDPTTLNRQGNDIGTQYRSAIFYRNEDQHQAIRDSLKKLEASGIYKDPIVTQIVPFEIFYPAESYHRDYFDRNREQSYCRLVIDPKVTKLYKDFKDYIN